MKKPPLTEAQLACEVALLPEWPVLNALQHVKYGGALPKTIEATTLLETVIKQSQVIKRGDVDTIERHLYAQAVSLHLMYSQLMAQMGESETLGQIEVYGALALKAQRQSRAAFLAVAELRNPNKATFIKQQNNAVNLQVNNGFETENLANELLTGVESAKLGSTGQTETIRANPNMETLGSILRTEDGTRQEKQQNECSKTWGADSGDL